MTILQGPNALTTGPIQAGPMTGQVGPTDALIWAQARTEGILTCTVGGTTISVGATAFGPYGIVKFHLTGLAPSTPYIYRITSSTEAGTAIGYLKTAPADTGRRCRIAFGSCFHNVPEIQQPIFESITNDDPDLFVFAGDSVYFGASDYDTQDHLILGHLRTRNQNEVRAMLSQIPTIATWDDHDYGPNNSNKTFANQQLSLQAWQLMWPNEQFGASGTPGVFSRVRFGPAELFLLDDRYYRTPPSDAQPGILGAAQLTWLQNALSSSTAPIKLIVSGSVVLPDFIGQPHISGWEGWRTNAGNERNGLLSYIDTHNIKGVIFLSGDLHTGYLYHRRGTPLSGGRRSAEVWELTSSPLANTRWDPVVVDRATTDTFYDPGVNEEVRIHNYGMVDIDLDRTGKEVSLSLRSDAGAPQFTMNLGIGTLATRAFTPRLRAITWVGGKAYFFKGDRYVRYTIGNVGSVQHVDSGYPAPIAGNWQTFDQVDAGFVTGSKAYLFNANGYLRMSPDGDPLGNAGTWSEDPDYPAYIAHIWDGFFRFDFDAAVVWPSDNKLYVFRGTQFVRCAIDAHVAEAPPAAISSHFPDVLTAFPDGIDAVVVWSSTTVYFFKGTQYARYTIGQGIDLSVYPKSYATAWPDLVTL